MKKYYIFMHSDFRGTETQVLVDNNGDWIYSVQDLNSCPEEAKVYRGLMSCKEFIDKARSLEFPNEIEFIEIPEDEEDMEHYIQAFFQKVEA